MAGGDALSMRQSTPSFPVNIAHSRKFKQDGKSALVGTIFLDLAIRDTGYLERWPRRELGYVRPDAIAAGV
jgi:hypothetical protein